MVFCGATVCVVRWLVTLEETRAHLYSAPGRFVVSLRAIRRSGSNPAATMKVINATEFQTLLASRPHKDLAVAAGIER